MTIYDIAALAGVSASTVSRVVNHKPGIREETRQRVQELLDQHNYSPNEAARGLVTKASRLIGILIEDIRYAHHTDIAYCVEEEMSSHGYCSLILNTGLTDEKKCQAIRVLEQRQVDGILLVGSTFQCEAVKAALQTGLADTPVVMANGYLELPNVKGVLVDERQGVENCVKLLASRGHRRLACVLPGGTPSSASKGEGFRAGMAALGIAPQEAAVYQCRTSLEEGEAMMERILAEHPETDGVIFGEDLAAVGAIRTLMERGISIPDQIAVIGVDNSRYCDICYPRLTSLNNRMLEMSMEAARILLDSLEGRSNPEKIMLFSSIVERETT